MDFAYSLETLGNYYRQYIMMMQHWHGVLPPGYILDVRYEAVVEDVKRETGRMLDHIGLPLDDACLEFYNNKRVVKTASIAQVRRPIYTTSVSRWRHFKKHLDPLMRIVEQYRN